MNHKTPTHTPTHTHTHAHTRTHTHTHTHTRTTRDNLDETKIQYTMCWKRIGTQKEEELFCLYHYVLLYCVSADWGNLASYSLWATAGGGGKRQVNHGKRQVKHGKRQVKHGKRQVKHSNKERKYRQTIMQFSSLLKLNKNNNKTFAAKCLCLYIPQIITILMKYRE